MTLYSINNDDPLVYALMAKVNELQNVESESFDGYHRSRTSKSTTSSFQYPSSTAVSVSAPDATGLPSSLVLAQNLQGVMAYHFADTDAHLKADTVNIAFNDGYAFVNGTLDEVMAFANAALLDYNAHLSQSGVHRKNDASTVSITAAVDQTTADNMLNAIKAALNIHMGSAPTVGRISINIPQPL